MSTEHPTPSLSSDNEDGDGSGGDSDQYDKGYDNDDQPRQRQRENHGNNDILDKNTNYLTLKNENILITPKFKILDEYIIPKCNLLKTDCFPYIQIHQNLEVLEHRIRYNPDYGGYHPADVVIIDKEIKQYHDYTPDEAERSLRYATRVYRDYTPSFWEHRSYDIDEFKMDANTEKKVLNQFQRMESQRKVDLEAMTNTVDEFILSGRAKCRVCPRPIKYLVIDIALQDFLTDGSDDLTDEDDMSLETNFCPLG